jgi:hypothetical protein
MQKASMKSRGWQTLGGCAWSPPARACPPILWVILIFAGVVTIGFTYLFGLENTWAHRLMVASLAAVIALVLFTISSLEHPFYGGTHVSPGAFELVLDRFETSKLSDLR